MTRIGPESAGLLTMAAVAAILLLWSRRSDAVAVPTIYPENPAPDWTSPDDSLAAFLWMIRNSEHDRRDVLSGDDYTKAYGRRRFYDMTDHPSLTGELSGLRLSNEMCRAAGLSPGCTSNAAGAYQIVVGTWNRVRKAGQWGDYLPDFGPASQDEAARRLLIERGALQRLEAGDFAGAVAAASKEWASLPGSRAGQPQRDFSEVISFYEEGLQNVRYA